MSRRARFDDAWEPEDSHMTGAGSSHGSVSPNTSSDENPEVTSNVAPTIGSVAGPMGEIVPSDWANARTLPAAERSAGPSVPAQVQEWESRYSIRPSQSHATARSGQNVTRAEADAAMVAVAETQDDLAEGLDAVAADVQDIADRQDENHRTAEEARRTAATADERAQAAWVKARETQQTVDAHLSQTENIERATQEAVRKAVSDTKSALQSHQDLEQRTTTEFDKLHGSLRHLDYVQDDQAAKIEALREQLQAALGNVTTQKGDVTQL